MKLTKDEARILGELISDVKYDFAGKPVFKALSHLEDKLKLAGIDNRRNGRTSMDDFNDCLKRFEAANRQPTTDNPQQTTAK